MPRHRPLHASDWPELPRRHARHHRHLIPTPPAHWRRSRTTPVRLESRGRAKTTTATTPDWDARCACHSVRCQRGKTPLLFKIQPTPSHAYDVSAAIWARITAALRDKTSNPYDASSGQSTMAEKDVTVRPARSVLDCASPLALSHRQPDGRNCLNSMRPWRGHDAGFRSPVPCVNVKDPLFFLTLFVPMTAPTFFFGAFCNATQLAPG